MEKRTQLKRLYKTVSNPDREMFAHYVPEISELEVELGVAAAPCAHIKNCVEIVSELHFKTCCMGKPYGCPFFDDWRDGKLPKQWMREQ